MESPSLVHDLPYYEIAASYRGDLRILCGVLGIEAFTRLYGWRVLYLVRCKNTVKKHCQLLGISIREFPEYTVLSFRSDGLRYLQSKNLPFWPVVAGTHKLPSKETSTPDDNMQLPV